MQKVSTANLARLCAKQAGMNLIYSQTPEIFFVYVRLIF